jgi:hypothetical protein
MVQWSKVLHRTTNYITTDPGSIPNCVAASHDWETHEATNNWPSVVRVRPAAMSMFHCALATPVVGRAHARWHGRQEYGVSSDTLVLASGLRVHCVKKPCGLAGLWDGGRTALDLRLSRFCTEVAAMGQYCNYQLDMLKFKLLLHFGDR